MNQTQKIKLSLKQAIVILVLLSALIIYKVADSPAQLRNEFLTEVVAWNFASLLAIFSSVAFIERSFLCNWFRCSFLKIALSRVFMYLSFSSLITWAGILYYESILPGFNGGSIFWSSILFYTFVYFISTLGIEVSKLVGKGFIEKLILGNYHSPKQEERIFLFIDMKESTRLSKELTLVNYSLLVKEFFYDIDRTMEKFDGEIYQYAGDEVIVSWPASSSNYDKAVRSFMEFYEQMKLKRSAYIMRYGVAPSFKAALHSGTVIASWMGRMKRELVFQGEVLNIAARVTSLAKSLSYPMLLTKSVIENLSMQLRARVLEGGNYYLRGVEIPISVYFLRLDESTIPVQKGVLKTRSLSERDAELLPSA